MRVDTVQRSLTIALFVLGLAHTARAQEATEPKQQPAADEKAIKDSKKAPPTKVVDVKESKDDTGEKSYEFGAVEVEGRLKAPQILYFLRRVRAEFRAGLLGHRSFLPELSDTRRSPVLK